MVKDFLAFLKEYNIVGVALAFVLGTASNTLVKSLVDNIIMPLFDPLLTGAAWREAVLEVGPFSLKWGAFLADSLQFIILAFVIFIVVRKLLKSSIELKK